MNILIIGSGGREHALAWQCAKDSAVSQVFVANGNAGTAQEAKCTNIALDTSNHADVIAYCQQNAIALVIVGPEAPLVAGLVDDCRQAGIKIWGPTQYCAQLEGSKTFAKEFMAANNIPTASYQAFTDMDAAYAYIAAQGAPIVIKADGLAAGKGVIVAETVAQAQAAVADMLADNKFGDAGHRVVIEQFLQGEEASFICLIDGNNILPMASSQDHKRIGEGDTGPNTGGMGAYSPAPVVTEAVHQKVMARVIEPVVTAMQAAGHPYTGFLYAGLMIDANADPYVIEFNCRFGDPETQPILMRLQSSLVQLIEQGLAGNLPKHAQWDSRPALGIVMASAGYPQSAASSEVITGLPPLEAGLEASLENPLATQDLDAPDLDKPSLDAAAKPLVKVFHAGTKVDGTHIMTNGGRVLCVTALGDSIFAAQQAALAGIAAIRFNGAQYRRDIGYQAIAREPSS